MSAAPVFDRAAFGDLLKATRNDRFLNVREAGKQAGVSAATVSRAERGDDLCVVNWLRLLEWAVPGAGHALANTAATVIAGQLQRVAA